MYKGKMVVIDLETTGLDIYHDEIIEFAALCIQDGKESETKHFLVQPSRKAPERILRLTGITLDQLQQSDLIENHREQIISFLENAVIVGHNINFDLGMLEKSLNIHFTNRVWDTLELTRIFFPTMNKYRLGDLAKSLGFEISEKMHRALPDVQVTWQLLQACWDKGIELDLSFYQRALPLVTNTNIADFFKELEGTIKKRFPDRPIRTDIALKPLADGLFSQDYQNNCNVPDNGQWIETCFGPGGILENQLAGYESRKGQYMMAKAVTNALETSGNLIAEAGTGTGKSYAYLIPGLWWSKRTGKKVVVATHTIPLQEQLYKKDLPVLAKVLPFSFNGALLKGKGNYLCIKKWLWLQSNYQELGLNERIALLSVLIWLRETESGDWQEIAQIPGLSRVWSDLNAEYDGCVPGKCSESERCFMLQARKKAEEADVIIINHSLLFSDIKTGNNVLPEYHELVIDEAHHLHQSALEQLGREISLEQISRSLDLLHRPMGGSFYGNIKARSGFWSRIIPSEAWERFSRNLEELPGSCQEIYEQAEEVYRFLAQILREDLSYRFTIYSRNESWWETLAVQFENLHGRLGKALDLLRAMLNSLSGLEIDECDNLCYEIAGRSRELEEIRECFALALQVEETTRVTWLEKSNHLTLKTSPVDVSKILKEKLFSMLDSAILTSATVSVSGSFRHFLADVGLPDSTPTILVDSPFDYEKQMRLFVVKDLLDSKQSNLFDLEEIVDFVAQVTGRMQGRTLVLFTSHRLLRDIHEPLKARLEEIGLELFAQGLDGSRKAILEEFMKTPKSVLLGANSFWEGIDIPGDKLSCVILIKLPFWPPNMPLIAARSEYLEAQGKNSFNDFLLPEAVLRFKQGFGRLIRSKSDRGLVILCDARAIEKRYGKVFLTSLPLRTHTRGNKNQILDNIDCWLDQQYQNQALL
jgi:ATP-dependent DNA helicase DinG